MPKTSGLARMTDFARLDSTADDPGQTRGRLIDLPEEAARS